MEDVRGNNQEDNLDISSFGYNRVYLPLYIVADTPFHIISRETNN